MKTAQEVLERFEAEVGGVNWGDDAAGCYRAAHAFIVKHFDQTRKNKDELATVRADITRTALVVQALTALVHKPNGMPAYPPYEHELDCNTCRLCTLLSRERELMGKVSR